LEHQFNGKWITNEEFYNLQPRNVFHRQLEKMDLPCDQHRNRHILFRRTFNCESAVQNANLYISADDYYKLYINGVFVGQGPSPSYHFQYNYNVIDVSSFLHVGKNVIAVHTLYQGLINRVWQSGDNRHGLILDLEADGKPLLSSDECFKTALHTGYTETGICGYDTQFLEQYDSAAPEVGFFDPSFDDTAWDYARIHQWDDHTLTAQRSHMLEFETISPVIKEQKDNIVFCDFGSNYVGYLCAKAKGKRGDYITIRCGQELENDSVRYKLRANCEYSENWLLADGENELDWFDYKAFRYAELILPEGVELTELFMTVRHYPFRLQAKLKDAYSSNHVLRQIWDLCINTQKYGVQEVIQDCMEREKGFYLGDGCYTALANMLLTGDDSMVRKLIDDAFSTTFITDTLVTCMDCSLMQEIAEYPLILIYLILWHYRITEDREYLAENYPKVCKLLDAYCSHYEKDDLLRDLDKWCVVEWPANFRDGYDVDIREGQVCRDAHIAINAYYIEAIRSANSIAKALSLPPYRDEEPLRNAFYHAFYDETRGLFCDGEHTDHTSLIGNCFAYALSCCRDNAACDRILAMLKERRISALSMFCTFPVLAAFVRDDRYDLLEEALLDEGAWKRMLREDATTTFEGWGRDTKWNTSLFHLTMSYAAIFLADVDLKKIFAK